MCSESVLSRTACVCAPGKSCSGYSVPECLSAGSPLWSSILLLSTSSPHPCSYTPHRSLCSYRERHRPILSGSVDLVAKFPFHSVTKGMNWQQRKPDKLHNVSVSMTPEVHLSQPLQRVFVTLQLTQFFLLLLFLLCELFLLWLICLFYYQH